MTRRALAFALTLVACAGVLRAEDGVVTVKLGVEVPRTIDDVKAANLAYGPKQDIDPDTGETHVYLPYGNNPALYWGPVDGGLADPKPGSCAEFYSASSDKVAGLTYKLVFDKPVAAFRCFVGYSELVLAPTCVAGAEYSVDGKTWTTIKEHPKGTRAVAAPFVDKFATITGLDTRMLYVRFYARDGANPTATGGPEMYLKMRISGDVGWGDSATTFFTGQNQIWVTAK